MSDFDWAPFGNQGGAFVQFEDLGDEFVGTIRAIRTHVFPKKGDENPRPTVLLDCEPKDGGELVTLSCGAVNLRQQMAEIQPQVGDLIAVKFTGREKIPGSPQPMKVFAVKHKVGDRPAVAPAEPEPLDDIESYDDSPF